MTEHQGTARTDQEPGVDFVSHPAPFGSRRCQSLVHALQDLSRTIPADVAYTFLLDGDQETVDLTFRELDWQARAIAARLQRDLRFGDRAALVFEPGLDYIAALVGCLYAGIVAVPVYPPDPMRLERTVTRLDAILNDAQTDMILTGPEERKRFGSLLKCRQIVETNSIEIEEGTDWVQPDIRPDTLAFLQYTSGSTGTPKGVMLTHANLMFNFEHIKRFDEPDGVAVSWLPMYHDMGLIGLVLQALQSGRRTILMSPLSFVKRPFNWLNAISRYRAYATSGPNFAYELCVQKISDEELAQLDLSCWTLACNGAEPIRIDTMRRFTERFAGCGFRPEVFYPCYGLAEATLIVSGGDKFADPKIQSFCPHELDQHRVVPKVGGREIVGCGESVIDQEICIVHPDSNVVCDHDEVGEIWVRGPGVAEGYWNNAESTKETFRAETSTGDGPYLRTGDLGFMQSGELYVTGRIKDLIIIRGRNHYPQDIERTVENCHRSLRRDHGAAFAINVDGEERLVVVQGVVRPQKLDMDQLFADIRTAILHEHELSPYAIVLVKCGEIPRTSSGKIQRRGCRELYEQDQLRVVAEWSATDALAAECAGEGCCGASMAAATQDAHSKQILDDVGSIIAELKGPGVVTDLNRESMLFADLNLESIDLVMLNELIERHYQIAFPFSDFMAELGRKNQRDIAMGQFVDFIREQLAT